MLALVPRFEVVDPKVDERDDEDLEPMEVIKKRALTKAQSVAPKIKRGLIIGCDTAVIFEGALYGKPSDAEDAKRILRRFRGKAHQVVSSLAVVDSYSGRVEVGTVATQVQMRCYSEEELHEYVSTLEPLDKAGGYAVQGKGGSLVVAVNGCYNNVVGLPLCEVSALLEKFHFPLTVKVPLCTLPSGDPCPRLFGIKRSEE